MYSNSASNSPLPRTQAKASHDQHRGRPSLSALTAENLAMIGIDDEVSGSHEKEPWSPIENHDRRSSQAAQHKRKIQEKEVISKSGLVAVDRRPKQASDDMSRFRSSLYIRSSLSDIRSIIAESEAGSPSMNQVRITLERLTELMTVIQGLLKNRRLHPDRKYRN
jgi:hypothetical protein